MAIFNSYVSLPEGNPPNLFLGHISSEMLDLLDYIL